MNANFYDNEQLVITIIFCGGYIAGSLDVKATGGYRKLLFNYNDQVFTSIRKCAA